MDTIEYQFRACARVFILLILASVTIGCDRRIDHQPLTRSEYQNVNFATLIPERFWGDEAPLHFEEAVKASAPILRARFPDAINATLETAPLQAMLVISGGGANGAFGAGVLAGWSAVGTRPQFSVVSGVSTGAMIAPFAFLGSDYDKTLLDIYSSVNRDDVYNLDALSGGLFGSALADTAPLKI